MRYFLLLAAMFVAGLPVFGQWVIGLGGGLGSNSLQTNIANRPQQSLQPMSGLFFELPLSYSFQLGGKAGMGRFGITVEASCTFLQKNYSLNRTDTLQDLDQQYRNAYGQLPLAALFFYKKGPFCVELGGGYYIGYWISGRVKGGMPDIFNTALPYPATYSFDEAYVFDDNKDNRWENGWTAQGRFAVRVQGTIDLFAAGHFFQAVTDQQKAYMLQQIPRYNSTWVLSLGLQKQFRW